jgi:hypothetical protein
LRGVASTWIRPEQRRSPRIDVQMRVNGEISSVETPLLVHDIGRSGFAVVSTLAFERGVTLDFRLTGVGASDLVVVAEAVHSRAMRGAAQLYLTGFQFVPGRLTGLLPQAAIDRFIEAITPHPPSFFFGQDLDIRP